MNWFILIGAILLICIALIIIGEKTYEEGLAMFGWGVGICTFLAIVIMSFTLINIKANFRATINEYEVLKAQVENYKRGDYGNASEIMSKTLYMNSVIARHKAMADSKWSGPWYSKEIGELEPIILGEK